MSGGLQNQTSATLNMDDINITFKNLTTIDTDQETILAVSSFLIVFDFYVFRFAQMRKVIRLLNYF